MTIGNESLRLAAAGLLLGFFGVAGCAHGAKYVWVEDYESPPDPAQAITRIARGDVLQVRVFSQDQLSTRARVRSDGNISIPLLDDVQVAGFTPPALARDLESRLKSIIKNPVVTVSIEESRPKTVLVLGEVNRPGPIPLETGSGVLQALAAAGGLSPDASDDRVFVLRTLPARVRIRLRYEALLDPGSPAAEFKLREGDVILVE